MKTYEYGRIATLAENLEKAGIAEDLIDRIMEGGEDIRKGARPEKKADWMRTAMQRMDKLLDRETRYAVREGCACCLGGKRLKTVKAISKNHETFEDRIKAADEARSVFGHSVTLQDDGQVLVCFSPEGQSSYRCVCLPKANAPLPITYCYCCGGHVRHHLQIALDRSLKLKVRSSALSSGGKQPCTFLLSLNDA